MLKKILQAGATLVVLLAVSAAILYFNKPLRLSLFMKPWSAFDAAAAPPAPDYTNDAAWAALPDRADNADLVPPDSEASDNQPSARVDVFFIHPTTYYKKTGWNAPYDEGGATLDLLEAGVLRFQASAFNGSARVYAPRYRQATLYSFIGKTDEEFSALDFAYQDVARAFDNFTATRNQDRPFIIAAHSQGSLHGMRLLKEKIAGTPLARRFIAAYLIGSSMPRDSHIPGIGPCMSATETSCYMNWNSVRDAANRKGWTETGTTWSEGRYHLAGGVPNTCVNPLTWVLDSTAPAAENLGGLPFVESTAALPAPIRDLTGATCQGGLLVVSPPTDSIGFTYGVNNGDYHIYDYNLFYMNVRANVAARVAAFLSEGK